MYLDLSGIFEVLLDFADDFARHHGNLVVADHFGLDEDTDLAAGLMAYDLSTPLKEFAISSSFCSRLIYASRFSRRAPGRAAETASAACTRQATMVLGSTSL